jgi:hypothetical protein
LSFLFFFCFSFCFHFLSFLFFVFFFLPNPLDFFSCRPLILIFFNGKLYCGRVCELFFYTQTNKMLRLTSVLMRVIERDVILPLKPFFLIYYYCFLLFFFFILSLCESRFLCMLIFFCNPPTLVIVYSLSRYNKMLLFCPTIV